MNAERRQQLRQLAGGYAVPDALGEAVNGGDGRAYGARATAAALGISERTVRRWIADGLLSAEKRGGEFLIDPDEARAVLNRSRAGRAVQRSSELAELRGRYAEVCDQLAREREARVKAEVRAQRLSEILYPFDYRPAQAKPAPPPPAAGREQQEDAGA